MLVTLIAKNLLQRPLRYILTGMSIAFGVAAVTAVFIFTDGLRSTFNDLAGNIQSGFDVSIQNDAPFGDGVQAAVVPVALAEEVAALDSVAGTQPRIVEFGVVAIDGDGEPRIANGPNLGVNWEADTPNPSSFVVDGREPTGPGEFVIDRTGFENGNFVIGENYRVLTPSGSEEYELVGNFNFADEEENASVGAVLLAFEQDFALELLNGGVGYDDVTLLANGDIDELIAELEPIVAEAGDNLVVVSQADLIEEAQGDFGQILGIFQTVLLVFAGIILLVSAFLIFNVFTITLGQRIKELGLLRAIGAFGSQVTSMMLGEALFLGVIATIVGLPAGWLLARLLRFALSQLGFPGNTGLPINPLTIVWAILVGVVVTLLAAVWPSVRARRVAPMAALRDGPAEAELEAEPNLPAGIAACVVGAIVMAAAFLLDGWLPRLLLPLVAGVLIYLGVRWLSAHTEVAARLAMLMVGIGVLTAVRFGDFGLGETFGMLGAGAILTILGASLVSGIFAGPTSRIIGLPIPLAIVIGLLGVVMALSAIGSIVGLVILVADGSPAGIALVFPAVIAAIAAYGLIRTAIGAFGLTGQLSRENAARNPSRTATTATALMIGLALVTGVTVIGDSIKSSVTNALDSSITADWLIQGPQAGPQGLPFSTEVEDIAVGLDEIDQVVPYQFTFGAFAAIEGAEASDVQAAVPRLFAAIGDDGADPTALQTIQDEIGATSLSIDDVFATDFATVEDHINPDFVERDPSVDPSEAIWMEDGVAADRGLSLGDTFVAVFTDGQVTELTVAGIYTDGFVFGNQAIDFSLWNEHLPSDTRVFLTATTADGVDAEDAREALNAALETDYPVLTVQDRSEFAQEAEDQINQTLATVNVLLLLSALIAILGIAIALSLAVFERTREIGLLRAVGTTRMQTRWMIRWEGVIVAAFGGIVGVILGVGLGVLATQKMPEFLVNTTSIPWPQLILYIFVAAVTGLGAGAFPAWIAGRMNVLEAISNE